MSWSLFTHRSGWVPRTRRPRRYSPHFEILETRVLLSGPTITPPVGLANAEGNAVSLYISVTDTNGGLSYSATALPAGLTIAASTGLISGAVWYGVADHGPTALLEPTVTVIDSRGLSARASFAWTISDTNRLPAVAAQTDKEGQSVSLNFKATDNIAKDLPLRYSASGLPPGLLINPVTGLISGQVGYNAVPHGKKSATYNATVTLRDWHGTKDFAPLALLVPSVPLVNPSVAYNDFEGDSVSDAIAGGPTTGVTYSATGLPPSLTINPTSGVVTSYVLYTPVNPSPNANSVAMYTVTFTGVSAGVTNSATATWSVTDVNRLPALLAQSNAELASPSVNFAATDNVPSDLPLTYTASGLPPGLTINGRSGVVSGTISDGAVLAGTLSVYFPTIKITDRHGGIDTHGYTWSVSEEAGTPLVNPSVAYTDNEGDNVNVAVTNGPTNGITYKATGLPPSLAINPTTGVVSGYVWYTPVNPSPNAAPAATYTVTFSGVSAGVTDFALATWTVSDANRLPALAPLTNHELDAPAVNFTATDRVPGDVLTYSETGLPLGLAINASTGVITGQINDGAVLAGTLSVYYPSITVVDQHGATDHAGYTWSISEEANVPLVNPLPSYIDNEGDSVNTPVTNAGGPSGVTYNATGLPPGLAITATSGVVSGNILYTPVNPSPNAVSAATYTVTFSGASAGFTDYALATWTVSDLNRLPALLPLSNYELDSPSVNFTATDNVASDLPLSYSATGLPPGLTINAGTGAVTGKISEGAVPPNAALSVYYPLITVVDQHGATDSHGYTWSVSEETTSVLINPSVAYADNEGDSVSFAITSTVTTGVTYSATGLPPGLTITATTGVVNGNIWYTPVNPSPNAVPTATYTVTFTGTSAGYTDTSLASWTVTDVNRLPSLVPLNNMELDSPVVTFSATDNVPGDTPLSYTATGLPLGLTINSSTGIVRGMIKEGAVASGTLSVYYPSITVVDQHSATDSHAYTWSVSDDAYNFAATEGLAYTSAVLAASPSVVSGYTSATIAWGDGTTSPGTISINGTLGEVFGTHTYLDEGTSVALITLSGGTGTLSTTIISVEADIADASLSYTGSNMGSSASLVLVDPTPLGPLAETQGSAFSSVTLATFTTTPNGAGAGATIQWGDGTSSSASITSSVGQGGETTYSIIGAHTYNVAGAMIARISTAGGWCDPFAVDIDVAANPAPLPFPLQASPKRIFGTEGIALPANTPVATFNDENPSHVCHTATVVWGDGTSNSNVPVYGDATNLLAPLTVSASHTYATGGDYEVSVTIKDDLGRSVTVYEDAFIAVRNPALTSVSASASLAAQAGVALTGALVGLLSNPNVPEGLGGMTLAVDWGDGSGWQGLSTVSVSDKTAPAWLLGTHTYNAAGTYTATVLVNDADGGYAYLTEAVKVADALPSVSAAVDLGRFNDANPLGSLSDFTASVTNWGDGASGSATVATTTVTQQYDVTASHLWSQMGSYPVGVKVVDDGGQTLTWTKSALVGPAALSAASVAPVTGSEGGPVTLSGTSITNVPVVGFTDPNYPGDSGSVTFGALIDWGDGSQSPGTVAGSSVTVSGTVTYTFAVSGSHIYGLDGSYSITALVTDNLGRSSILTNSATIGEVAPATSYTASPSLSIAEAPALFSPATNHDGGGYVNQPTTILLASVPSSSWNLAADGDTRVLIDWGDGSGIDFTGWAQADGKGGYDLYGAHTYANPGTYTVAFSLSDGVNDTSASHSATTEIGGVPVYTNAGTLIYPQLPNSDAIKAYIVRPPSLVSTNSRDTNDPSAPTTTAVGEATAELNTGSLRLSQPLDFDQSPGTSVGGNPALVYNSALAAPHVAIQVQLQMPTGAVMPSTVSLTVTWDGVVQTPVVFTAAGTAGQTVQYTVLETGTQTRGHSWSVAVALGYGDVFIPAGNGNGSADMVAAALTTDTAPASQSAIGPGWGIAGIDQLEFVCGGILWVTGSGDARLFRDATTTPATTGDGTYTSPPEDFGTLVQNDDFTFTYTAVDQSVYMFDAQGHLLSVTTPDGVMRSYGYDNNERLIQVVAPDGSFTTLTYDPTSGLLDTIVEPCNGAVTLTHDGSGNVTGITDEDGNTRIIGYAGSLAISDTWAPYATTFGYAGPLLSSISVPGGSDPIVAAEAAVALDTSGAALASLTDGLGFTTSYGIDLRGRKVSEQQPDGGLETWTRNSAGLVTVDTNAALNSTYNLYDTSGDVTQTYDTAGDNTTYQYDPVFHHVTVQTDYPADGDSTTTTYSYDSSTGDLLTTTEYYGTAAAATTTNTWFAGLMQTSTDPDGNLTDYFYDGARRVTEVIDYDSHGNLVDDTTYSYASIPTWTVTTTTAKSVTVDTYSGTNRLLQETVTPPGSNIPLSTTENAYLAAGLVALATDADGNATSNSYDTGGQLTYSATRDKFGNLVTQSSTGYDPAGNPVTQIDGNNNTTTNNFNGDGDVTHEQTGSATQDSSRYNALDEVTYHLDGDGNYVYSTHDSHGNLTLEQTYDPLGDLVSTESWQYDAKNNVTQHIDADGVKTVYQYDAHSHLTFRAVYPTPTAPTPTETESWTYDATSGLLTAHTDPNNVTTNYQYNGADRLTFQQSSDGQGNVITETWQYDSNGNLVSHANPNGMTTANTYDGANRLVLQVDMQGTTVLRQLSWQYDQAGNLLSATDADGTVTTSTFDADNNMLTRVVADRYSNVLSRESWTYDGNGNVLTYVDARNVTTTSTYDGEGQVLTKVVTSGGTTVSSESWTYDGNGNVLTYTNPDLVLTTNTYDALNRMTVQVVSKGGVTIQRQTWTYDANSNQTGSSDPNATATTEAFDALGRVTSRTVTKNSQVVQTESWTYDQNGNTLTYLNPDGVLTTNTYDDDSRILTKVVTKGTQTVSSETWTYDRNGNTLTYLDPNGIKTTNTYDGEDRTLTKVVTKGTQTVSSEAWTYDDDSNVLTYVNPDNVKTTSTYDGEDRVLTKVVTKGTQTVSSETWTYDANGNTLTYLDPDGVKTTNTYDGDNRVLTKVITSGTTTLSSESWTYDGNGNVLVYTDPKGITTATTYDGDNRELTKVVTYNNQAASSETWTYDGNGNVLTYLNPDSVLTTSTYDGDNRVLTKVVTKGTQTVSSETWTYDANGNVLTYTDADAIVTTKTYDGDNRVLTQVVTKNGTTVKSESWTYDPSGNVLTYTDQAGNVTTSTYDGANDLTLQKKTTAGGTLIWQQSWGYDDDGNQTQYIDGNGNTFDYSYDGEGDKISQLVYDHSSNLLDQEAWTYDGDGNELTHTWNDGKVTTSSYDGDNRVILKVTRDSIGNFLYQESWQYDANGNLLLYTDALGRQTQYTYDGLGRKLTETVGYGTSAAAATSYGYDADGNVTKLIDPRLNETDIAYDPLGDKISTTEVQLTQTANAAFDGAGLMTSSTNPDGSKRLYTYDGDGRLLTDTWYDAQGNLVQVNSFTYDADGNMLTASNPAGTYSFTYDGQGRLVNVNEPGGLALTFGYDENGNRTLAADSLGGTTASSYDWANRLVGEVQSQSGTPTLTVDQSYDWAGRIAAQVDEYTDGTGTHVVAQTSYGYDAKSELTSLVHKNAAGTVIADYEYSYDAAGELSQQTDHGTTTAYGYNSAGELTSAGPANYNYDLAGNPNNSGDSTGAGNELTLDPNWAYSYDANGNITKKVSRSDSTTWLYGYDNANEMLSAKKYNADPTVPGTGATLEEDVEFKYDALGNRIEKDTTPGGGSTTVQRYAYDGWNPAQAGATGNSGFEIWADLDGNSHLQTRYLRGDKIDQLFARVGTDNMPYWYKTDQQNTVRDLVNDSGTVADGIQYDAFGNIVTQTNPALLGRYAWTGREYDAETDLQYNHARYYNPTTGRWMSQDPLGFDAGDSNLYRYVNNRPTTDSDPSGLAQLTRAQQDAYNRYCANELAYRERVKSQNRLGGADFPPIKSEDEWLAEQSSKGGPYASSSLLTQPKVSPPHIAPSGFEPQATSPPPTSNQIKFESKGTEPLFASKEPQTFVDRYVVFKLVPAAESVAETTIGMVKKGVFPFNVIYFRENFEESWQMLTNPVDTGKKVGGSVLRMTPPYQFYSAYLDYVVIVQGQGTADQKATVIRDQKERAAVATTVMIGVVGSKVIGALPKGKVFDTLSDADLKALAQQRAWEAFNPNATRPNVLRIGSQAPPTTVQVPPARLAPGYSNGGGTLGSWMLNRSVNQAIAEWNQVIAQRLERTGNFGMAHTIEGMATPIQPRVYSVIFDAELTPAQAALRSRPAHFRIANTQLLHAVDADVAMMQAMQELMPGFDLIIRGIRVPATTSSPTPYVTWHHVPGTNRLQLVWRYQHELGNPLAPATSPWRALFHPDGSGGFATGGGN